MLLRCDAMMRERAIGVRASSCGTASATGHHGEILQGEFSINGAAHRALVTLPCRALRSTVRIALDEPFREMQVTVVPPWRTKARAAVEATLDLLRARASACAIVETSIPVRHGFGSSTADVVAAIRATASACATTLNDDVVARLAVATEGASDPTMYEGAAVVFAQRGGVVLRRLPRALPDFAVVGFYAGAAGAGVDTVEMPLPDYSAAQKRDFVALLRDLERALERGDAAGVGAVASASAAINQMYVPQECFALAVAVAEATGAAGLQVAHSGDVLGLLFDARDSGVQAAVERARFLLAEHHVEATWSFRSDSAIATLPGEVPD